MPIVGALMRASMKFDPSRAESIARELGDPRFAGPDGERRSSDFLAEQFAKIGMEVECREVSGSRFPQRAGPWVAWLGYGLLVSSLYGLKMLDNVLIIFFGGLILFLCCGRWVNALISNWIRPARWWPPIETAPVLIATLPGNRPARVRVVFQSVISGIRTDPFHFAFRGRRRRWAAWIILLLIPSFLAWTGLILRYSTFLHPERPDFLYFYQIMTRYVEPSLLVMVWVAILTGLSIEYRRSSRTAGQDPPDRRGLALLLEMARTWPKTGSRSIEPVFVVAGGQALDHAGSREIVRLLKSDWSSGPVLLVLLFAPGAGDELWIGTNMTPAAGLDELAEVAARSLWIPFRKDDPFILLSLWPFEDPIPAIFLIGSDPGAFGDGPVDPHALHRAAQLVTEIALRWSRNQEAAAVESPG